MLKKMEQDMIEKLGLNKLPEDKKMEVVLNIGKIIQQNIVLRVINELDEKGKDDFDKLLGETNDQEKILEFLKEKISNLDGIINEEIEKIKKEGMDLLNLAA